MLHPIASQTFNVHKHLATLGEIVTDGMTVASRKPYTSSGTTVSPNIL